MPYRDVREFIARLEQEGEIAHIKAEVDVNYELGAVCYKAFSIPDPEKRKALIFERPKGHNMPIAVNLLGTRKRMCLALDTTPEQFHRDWIERSRNSIKPALVESGLCQEQVYTGNEVDLTRFPIPIWNEKDGGPYITLPCWISKDQETGWRNVGMYRCQLHDSRTVGIWAGPYRHINMQWRKSFAKGESFPVAIAIGPEPIVTIVAVANSSYGEDELNLAGALRGSPVELVKCKTVPLEVPATSEWVLEGWIKPGAMKKEGPYGEAYGYYGESNTREYVEVTAITHRNNPIHQACYLHRTPNEASLIRLPWEAEVLSQYRAGGILKVNVIDSVAIASIRKNSDGQGKTAAMGFMGTQSARMIKVLIIVDEDVNPYNLQDVMWAISSRCQPERAVEILRDISTAGIDPSLSEESKRNKTSLTSKMIIDATKPVSRPFAEAVAPQKEALARVEKEWEKYGIR
jgi:UbiD family decarboxylase